MLPFLCALLWVVGLSLLTSLSASSTLKQLPLLLLRPGPPRRLRRHAGVCAALFTLNHRSDWSLPGSSHAVSSKIAPPSRSPCVLSGCPGPKLAKAPDTFRPCRSSRLRRFTPHEAWRVCCTPPTTMGFTWFRAIQKPLRATDLTLLSDADSLRSFSLSSGGFPVTRALPSRRYRQRHRSDPFASTSGLCSSGKSVAPERVATSLCPMLPWDFLRLPALTELTRISPGPLAIHRSR